MGNWINVAAGIWLIISPFIFGYATAAARSNDIIIGILVAGLSLIRVYSNQKNEGVRWVNFVLGLWLIAAPFVLAYITPAARTNDIILGIIVAFVSLVSSSLTTSNHRYAT